VGGEVRYYSVEEAARVLRLTPERVLEMVEAGELDGIPSGEATWRIPIHGDIDVPLPPVTAIPAEIPTGHSEVRDLPDEPGGPQASEGVEEARQPAELPRGDDAASTREATSESGWVTTQQAARALGISARTVRWHIERGNIEAIPEGEGVERTWRVSVDSLQAFRDSRQAATPSPRSSRASDIGAGIAAESPGSAIRELADRLVEEARHAEAARVRLELSERAQSTLEAELLEERRRREEAEQAREEAQRERDELRRRLDARRESPARDAPTQPSAASGTREVASRVPETPADGFGTDAAGGGPQRQASPRRWRWWRRS
jgi:excisionase family DNA binding protein